MAVESYPGFAQRYNMIIGVLSCAFLTTILFIIMPSGFFFMADMFLIVGNCIGLYITFKNRKESQLHIKTGLIVGLIGSVLSLILIGFFEWIFYSLNHGFDLIIFLNHILFLFLTNGIMYLVVGLIVGYIFGSSYRNKEE